MFDQRLVSVLKAISSTSPRSNLWSNVFTQLTEELRAKEGGGLREFSEGMIMVIGARVGSRAENWGKMQKKRADMRIWTEMEDVEQREAGECRSGTGTARLQASQRHFLLLDRFIILARRLAHERQFNSPNMCTKTGQVGSDDPLCLHFGWTASLKDIVVHSI